MKRNWNWAFFKFLVFIAILPSLVQFVRACLQHMDVMTLSLLFASLVLFAIMKQGLFWRMLRGLLLALFSPIIWLFGSLNRGSRFMPFWKRWRFLSPHFKGLVVDGYNRMTPKGSYQNLLVQGGVGTGKTANIIMPLLLLQNDASMVVTDLSGELYLKTSGDLKRRGFEIQVIDLMSFNRGQGFNPLYGIKTHTEVAQAAHVLIKSSGLDQGNDPFWSTAAEKLLRTLIQCLVNLETPAYLNLANLKYLLNSFGNQEAFNAFVVRATLNDRETYHEYLGLISGNEKTVSSILTTAQTALAGLSPDLGKMTAVHQVDFSQLRHRKTVVFVMVKQQDISQYAFVLNLLFTRLCHSLLSDIEVSDTGLPVNLALDEFGQLMIPDFEVFSATSRKYRVAFALVLQSLNQLEARYGSNQAKIIKDSIGTSIYFPGMGVELAAQLSRTIGKSDQRNKKGLEALMREDEVIHMKDDQALLIHSNKDPIKLKMCPYYKQRGLRNRSKTTPAPRPTNAFPSVEYAPLESDVYTSLSIPNPTDDASISDSNTSMGDQSGYSGSDYDRSPNI